MKIEKITLKNGIPVVIVPDKESGLVATSVMVKAGSRYEDKEEYGLSHYIEHTVFKGTKSYPSSREVMNSLEPYGAIVNAWTSEQATCYYNMLPVEHWDKALSVLSDLVTVPLFKSTELEKEKGPVIEEIRGMHDDPMEFVFHKIFEVMWPNQPIGNGIIGTEDNIKSFNSEMVRRYFKQHYTAANMLISVAGPVTLKEVQDKLNKYFDKVPPGNSTSPTPIKNDQEEPRFNLTYRNIKQSHVMIGYKTSGQNSPLRPATEVLNTVLGVGMSSILFREVREERGLAYTARSDVDFFSDAGILAVYAGLNAPKTIETINLIRDILGDLTKKPLPEKRINEAKELIRGYTLARLDGVARRGSWVATRGALSPETIDPDKYLAEINSVTAANLQEAAQEIFRAEKESLVVLGPFSNEEKFAKILD